MKDILALCEIVPFDIIAAELLARIKGRVSKRAGSFSEWVDNTRAGFPSGNAALLRAGITVSGDLQLDWGAELDKRRIRALVSFGNLTVDGALLNSNLDDGPLLFVDGDLAAQRIEHGGARTLVLGNVVTQGPVLCDYNHGVIRVGGDLTAEALILLDQDVDVVGGIHAPLFDWNDGELREHLVAEVFDDPDSDLPSGDLIRARLAQKLPVLGTA